jgi:hypothetical protein
MYSPELKAFIREHSSLFWYTPDDKKEEVSPELLVETILNYGDMEAVKGLIKLFGIREVAEIFNADISRSDRRRGNYFELTINYFQLLFSHYA